MAPIEPNTEMGDLIKTAHQLYQDMTGFVLELDYSRQHDWWAFLSKYTLEDLRKLIIFKKKGMALGRFQVGGLRFSQLISQLDLTEELMAEIKSAERKRKPTQVQNPGRESVLRATGRPTEEIRKEREDAARSAAQIIGERAKLAEQLKTWKQQNLL